MLKRFILSLIIILVLIIGILGYGYIQATRMPQNSPGDFLNAKPAKKGKVTVCIGNSITHGSVSFNYVDILSSRLGKKGFIFINAGINSELAYNVLERIDSVIKCKPDFITIMIGTNDANATMNRKNSERAIKNMGLPEKPTLEWYSENLIKICRELKDKTGFPFERFP